MYTLHKKEEAVKPKLFKVKVKCSGEVNRAFLTWAKNDRASETKEFYSSSFLIYGVKLARRHDFSSVKRSRIQILQKNQSFETNFELTWKFNNPTWQCCYTSSTGRPSFTSSTSSEAWQRVKLAEILIMTWPISVTDYWPEWWQLCHTMSHRRLYIPNQLLVTAPRVGSLYAIVDYQFPVSTRYFSPYSMPIGVCLSTWE